MKEFLLITQAYCSIEDCDGDFIIDKIRQKDLEHIKSFRNSMAKFHTECSSVYFHYYGIELIDNPFWDDDDQILFDGLVYTACDENGFMVISDPKMIKKIEDINTHRIDLTQVRFMPRLENEFIYSCHFKDTGIQFTSPIISIPKLEEILK